jgi:hypothetical protein
MSCNKSVNKFGTIKVDKISVTEIDIPSTSPGNDVGTLKLSDNLEIGGDGLILHDLEEFVSADNGETITYDDSSTAIATITIDEGETSTNILSSSVSKTIGTAEDIILNGKTFTITQSGTTVTIGTVKKIISLEASNLVIADYDTATGQRTNKEVIMDSNNSISEIANGAFDLKIKSLDVTKTDSINETTPSEGCVRIDDTLTVDGTTTLSGALNATTGAFTTLSTSNLLSANAGLTVANGTTLTSNIVDINGGAIDGTVIGATSAVAGTFTTLTVNDELVIGSNAIITGNTTTEITLNVKGTDNQTANLLTVEQHDGTDKLTVDKDGVTTAASLVVSTSLTITPSVITSASIDDDNPTNLDESVSVFYFDLNSTSAMYGIFAAGTTGQMINIFYDNNEAAGSLRIDFGATKLRTGSGESRYLTFTITGQSASLMYISTVDKWCVTNTGAAVS